MCRYKIQYFTLHLQFTFCIEILLRGQDSLIMTMDVVVSYDWYPYHPSSKDDQLRLSYAEITLHPL